MADDFYAEPARTLGGWLGAFWQIWLGRMAGPEAIAAARASRLRSLVQFARRHSPLYGELYRKVPDGRRQRRVAGNDQDGVDGTVRRLGHGPSELTRAPEWTHSLPTGTRIGERFDDRYVIWKSSGSRVMKVSSCRTTRRLGIYDALLLCSSPHAGSGGANNGRLGIAKVAVQRLSRPPETTSRALRLGSAFAGRRPGMDARGFSVMEPLDRSSWRS